jgi:hypothetical protein
MSVAVILLWMLARGIKPRPTEQGGATGTSAVDPLLDVIPFSCVNHAGTSGGRAVAGGFLLAGAYGRLCRRALL